MTESDLIEGTFSQTYPFGGAFSPYVRVSVITPHGASKEFSGVLDTGSEITLVEMSLAVELLQKTEAEITKRKHDIDISGVGDSNSFGWGHKVTLRLAATSVSSRHMLLRNVTLYATNAKVPHRGFLIGQAGALQGRSFIHLNYPNSKKHRIWKLGPKFNPIIK